MTSGRCSWKCITTVCRAWLVLLLVGVVAGPPLEGQPPSVTLGPPTASYDFGFTNVVAIRELSDGRVLVADKGETRLYVLTPDLSRVRQIGRVGEGPGEYRGVGPLHPLAADSSVFIDSYSSRWNLLVGSEITDVVSEHRMVNRMFRYRVLGFDDVGGVLGAVGGEQGRSGPDSLSLILVDRTDGSQTPLTSLSDIPSIGMVVLPAVGGSPPSILDANPLATNEHARLLPDGWIVVARLDPYRVDWRRPDGSWKLGSPIPHRQTRVDGDERCWAFHRFVGPRYSCDEVDGIPGWPESVPPFLPSIRPLLMLSPEGHVVIERATTSRQPAPRYDVVSREGELVSVIQLAQGEVLIGFGENSVYSIAESDLGVQVLRRHHWPPG